MEADTREMLRQRIQLATAEDQVSGVFCESAFLAVRELLGGWLAESVRASTWSIRQWGRFRQYPALELLRMVDAAADLIASRGDLSYTGALEEIGGSVTRIAQDTPFSRAAHLGAGDDPHDRLALSLGAARVFVMYGERKYERVGPTRGRLLWRRELVGPSFMVGAYTAIAEGFPGLRMIVTLEQCQEPGMDFQLLCSW
ncbi:TIGR02265 family protein [Archangium sp.]|uniref:TIGR02265 family protein n=1 Tax=Archangium sp. TaxID=1872627 RepID=UPI002D59C948|nr:DUF2378 family protein [Archangium sp.]HYO55336.1 DUF2378 family protein [Archangium sp.]